MPSSPSVRRVAALFNGLWIAIIAGLGLSGTPAQINAQSATPLSLAAVYRAVDSASPRVQAAAASWQAALARVPGASRLPDPRVQLQFMNRNLPRLGLANPLGMNQVQVSQMFPIAGQLGLSGAAASAQAAAVSAGATEVIWEQRTQAAMAFYEIYEAAGKVEVARETLRLLEDLVASLTAMYAVGDAQQADVLRAQLEIGRMSLEIENMVAMERQMIARLNGLLNRPPSTPAGRPVLPPFPGTVPPLDSLQGLALMDRAMIRGARETLAGAAFLERRAHREIWPDVEIGVTYGQRPMPDGGTDRMMSFMVGASIPLWAGSRQLRMRDESGAMRLMASADLEAMTATTTARIGEIVAELDRVRQLGTMYRTLLLPQAEATVASAQAAYQVGAVDFMTLLDAIMTVNRYREEIIGLAGAEGKAYAELEMLTGHPLISAQPAPTNNAPGGQS